MEWIKMSEHPPTEECQIVFKGIPDYYDDTIHFAIALPESKTIIVDRTNTSFEDVLYYIILPDVPV